jgi:hypothetical protein
LWLEGIIDVLRTDLDVLLAELYVTVDDHVAGPHRRKAGRPKRLTDAELVCLTVAQVLFGARSEHHWLRLCFGRLRHLFRICRNSPAATNGSWPERPRMSKCR